MRLSFKLPRTGRSGSRSRIVAMLVTTTLLGLLGVGGNAAHASTLGTAWAWGANVYGELGNGTTSNSATDTAQLVHNLASGVTTIAAGARHSLAIRCDGSVVAWGKNTAGELGNGTTKKSSVPVAVSGLGAGSGVVAVDGNAPPITASNPSGNGHSMALKSNGAVLGWGNNASGEVGNGSTLPKFVLTPVAVSGLGSGSGVTAIAAGGSFSMALKSNGAVLTWGDNHSGELGNGTLKNDPKPVVVTGLGAGSGVIAIAAGSAFALALKSNGAVMAWGNNTSGELGNGTKVDSKVPVHVTNLGSGSGVVAISAGDAFGMALKTNGTIAAWGNNQSGELGDGSAPNDHDTPVTVSGISGSTGVVAISTGFSHAMALTSTGSLYAWGDNKSGQLGDGNAPTEQDTPELLSGFTNATAVSAGGSHTLALHAASFSVTANVGDASIMEGDKGARTVTFPVTLSPPATTKVSVTYKVKAAGKGKGFATAGTDLKAASGTLTFTPSTGTGMTPVLKTIPVTIYGDTKIEPNETFSVVLTSSCSCNLGRKAAVGTIINDDAHAKATMGIGSGSIVEGNSGPARKITFPITLSKPVATTVTVTYTVSGTTAVYCATSSGCGDADFGGKTTGTVRFVPSKKTGLTKTVKRIQIPVWPDLVTESDETFTVQLSGLHGLRASQLIQPSAVGTIINDD